MRPEWRCSSWGNPIGVAMLIVSGVIAATCVMALVTTLARTPEEAQSWQGMVALVTALRHRASVDLSRYASVGSLAHAVSHGDVDAGIVIPNDYDARLARGAGVTIDYFARPDSVAQQSRTTVQSVAADQGRAFAAALLLQRDLGIPFADALARAGGSRSRCCRRSSSCSDRCCSSV